MYRERDDMLSWDDEATSVIGCSFLMKSQWILYNDIRGTV